MLDFKPFFCVFDNCSSPFTHAETFADWLSHMRTKHTKPEWRCWYCSKIQFEPGSPVSFSTPRELETHLKSQHPVHDSPLDAFIQHSVIYTRTRHPLQGCPFCGKTLGDFQRDRPSRDLKHIQEGLEKQVVDHLNSTALILVPVEMREPGDDVGNTVSIDYRGVPGH